jgi:hypothetical protein
MAWTPEFYRLVRSYENTAEWHQWAYEDFELKVRHTPWLFDHREWVVQNFWGFGDTAHWWLWKLLIEQVQDGFKFLEIGVYRGSILSLIPWIAKHQNKEAYTYGVTPLKPTTDDVHAYTGSQDGYEADVAKACNIWADGVQPQLMAGMSYEPHIIADIKIYSPFDIVYIDGGHTFECVAMDLFNYTPLVAKGGFLVMDDASWFLNFESHIWRGYESVGLAIRRYLETQSIFHHLFAIGHHRVFGRGMS